MNKIKQAKESQTHSCSLIFHNNFILKTFLNYLKVSKNIQNNYTYKIFTDINLAVNEFLRKSRDPYEHLILSLNSTVSSGE